MRTCSEPSPLSQPSAGVQAVRWPTGGGPLVPLGDLIGGASESQATAISANGLVVTGWGTSANGREAFRWHAGVMSGLGDLPGGRYFSEATALSGDGSTIVGRSASVNGIEAFRWSEAGGIVGLGDLPGGFAFSEAFGISDDGGMIVRGNTTINATGDPDDDTWTLGDATILGSLWTGHLAIKVGGNAIVDYCSSCLQLVDGIAPPGGNLVPRPMTVVSWQEIL